MKHPGLVALILGLALVGCTRGPDPANVASEAATTNVIETVPPSESVDKLNVVENSTAETGNDAAPTAIPAAFHGRWGINRADCISTRGDAKGLLTIDASQLKFYEAKGTLGTVLGATATSFDARYGFAGEGQTWMRTERFKLVDGTLQRRTDAERGQEPPVNLTYRRC